MDEKKKYLYKKRNQNKINHLATFNCLKNKNQEMFPIRFLMVKIQFKAYCSELGD